MVVVSGKELKTYLDGLVAKAHKHAKLREGSAQMAALNLGNFLQDIRDTNKAIRINDAGLPDKDYFEKVARSEYTILPDARNIGDEIAYEPITEEELLELTEGENLRTEQSFSAIEEKDALRFVIREEQHIDSYDRYSRDYPYLFTLHDIKHKIIFGQLISTVQSQSFKAKLEQASPEAVASREETAHSAKPQGKQYEDISCVWSFKRKHFQRKLKGRFGRTKKELPTEYEPTVFQAQGLREQLVRNVLEYVRELYGCQEVSLKDKEIADFCATPKQKRWPQLGHSPSQELKSRVELVDNLHRPIAELELLHPYMYYGELFSDCHKFGYLQLTLKGETFQDNEHFEKMRKALCSAGNVFPQNYKNLGE